MIYSPVDFLHSYCTWVAVRAAALAVPLAVQYGPAQAAKANLWRGQAIEASSQQPYAVARIYGGSQERINPKPTIAVQLQTIGEPTGDASAWALAGGLFELFTLDDAGRELRMAAVPGFSAADNSANGTWTVVDVVVTSRPGQLGRDQDRGRVSIISNFDIGFYKEQS